MSEFDSQDEKVVELISKLKNANGVYPSELLESRRQSFLNQMSGMGAGAAFTNVVKSGNGSGFTPPTAGTLLEVALVVAIIAEAGTLAFFYRDKVAEFFKSTSPSPTTHEVTSPPVSTFSFPTIEISEVPISAIPTEIVTTEIVADVAASTATPEAPGNLNTNNPATATQILTNSTPNPNANTSGNDVNNGNNGNHYGQTPKPERTKENNGNNSPNDNPGNGNNDKVPKDNSGNGNDDKPPKEDKNRNK